MYRNKWSQSNVDGSKKEYQYLTLKLQLPDFVCKKKPTDIGEV